MSLILEFDLPVVVANLDGDRTIDRNFIPTSLLNHYTISVSFQPKIIKYALDNYVPAFQTNPPSGASRKTGPRLYKASLYKRLGL